MAANYDITFSAGSPSFTIYPLEANGPGNLSVPRQIAAINHSVTPGSASFELNSDLAFRFVAGFTFTVTVPGSPAGLNDGTYTVKAGGSTYASGTNRTTIPVDEATVTGGIPFGQIQYSIGEATSLLLPGRGFVNYGLAHTNSFVHLLENFSSKTSPVNPIMGQQWFDKNATPGAMKVYAGSPPGWIEVGEVSIVGTPADNQVAIWTGAGTLEGDANFTWDGSTLTVAGLLQTLASATGSSGLNIPPGTAPTSPVDGDIWTTTAGAFIRINSVTESLLAVFTEDASSNIIGGTGAGAAIIGGSTNNFLGGINAGSRITTGDLNVAIGDNAGRAITTGANNIAMGPDALGGATGAVTLFNNIAIGSFAMDQITITTARENVALGQQTLRRVTTGDRNIGIGQNAGSSILSGADNIAIGTTALGNISPSFTGSSNIAIGPSAMNASALVANSLNVAIGSQSLNGLTTGSNNTAVGAQTGQNIGAGSSNVIVGYQAGPTGNQTSRLYINNATSDTPMIGGDFATGLVELSGTLRLTERADHIGTPAATFGEIWIRDDTPNVPIYTDDAGTDHNLLARLPDYDEQQGSEGGGSPDIFTTSFSFSTPPAGKTSLQVFVNGVKQKEATGGSPVDGSYTISAPNTVTFLPGNGIQPADDVEFYGFG